MPIRSLTTSLGLSLLLCAAAASAQPKQQPRDLPEPPPPGELAAHPAAGATADQVRVLLIADRETTLSSPITARITDMNSSMGMAFGQGQILVSFECTESQARLKMAQAELSSAQETQEARVRMQGLAQASDVEVAVAAAAVAKARGQVDLNQAQVGQCNIRAPWAGRVAKVHAKTFMSVTPGQPLLELVKSGPLRLKLNLPSRLVARVTKNTPLNVTIDETGKTYEARVQALSGRVDPVSQTVEIEATITKAYPELLPGMSGTANLAALR
jgi:membrane fusion protein (multidrug efflux system)